MSSKKAPVIVAIKAPILASAWLNVCTISSKSEKVITASVESMAHAMNSETRLSIAEQKKFIISTGKTSSFISTSHICALPSWLVMRTNVKGFKELPLSKQLSTATGAYDNLGAGKGETLATVEILTKATAKARKDKDKARKAVATVSPNTSAKGKNILSEMLTYLTALDYAKLSEKDWDTLAEISILIDDKQVVSV